MGVEVGVRVSGNIGVQIVSINGQRPDGNLTVSNDKLQVVLRVTGTGLVSLRDNGGKLLWSQQKTDPKVADLTANITLPGQPGQYVLTAAISNQIDGTAASSVTIRYQAAPLPWVPGLPDTGAYLKIAGYALPTLDVAFVLGEMAIFLGGGFGVLILIKKKKSHRLKFAAARRARAA
ncbi:MAG: hypothetical protein LBM73_03330 [Candidatus Nomurabacteria bacterium]|nr:hypothetical protein [Candidatus Nomurabacteria bacterium]